MYDGYLSSPACAGVRQPLVGQTVSVPVAVKVLPDMAKEQSKWDFEMEALIMR